MERTAVGLQWWLTSGTVNASRIEQPADLDVVRTSYDRVADNYVAMNLGDVTTYPWLRTAIEASQPQCAVLARFWTSDAVLEL